MGCQYSLYNGSCPSAVGQLPGSQLDLFIVACSRARLRLGPRKRAACCVPPDVPHSAPSVKEAAETAPRDSWWPLTWGSDQPRGRGEKSLLANADTRVVLTLPLRLISKRDHVTQCPG